VGDANDANELAAMNLNTSDTGGKLLLSVSEWSVSSTFPEYCKNTVIEGSSERPRKALILAKVTVDSGEDEVPSA
jgi:hypothetical protein